MGNVIFAGMRKPDYAAVRVPVLAFFALPDSLKSQLKRFPPRNADERAAIGQVYAADVSFAKRAIAILRTGAPRAKVIELTGANHYVYLSHEQDVLRAIRRFLAGLR